jgi:3-phosphoshikimate 1-carboxyvinyltransferase
MGSSVGSHSFQTSALSDPYPVQPFTRPAKATVRLPGSKSLTNRALVLAALSHREITLHGALFSDDTVIMLRALQALGFEASGDPAARTLRVRGEGGRIPAASADLFVGNAGTAARFLSALCCLGHGRYRLDGVPQMRRRPMAGLLTALESLGAGIESEAGRFPICIEARGLRGGEVALDASESSQMLSALLMVAPFASSEMRVRLVGASLRRAYVEMTARLMRAFGGPEPVEENGAFRISLGGYRPPEATYAIEPDASAASYFLALPGAVGGEVLIPGLRLDGLQGDAAFAQLMAQAGAEVTATESGVRCSVPPVSLPLRGLDADFYPISDTFLTMAALAPLLDGPTKIRGIAHSRHQECDRPAAMAAGLAVLGQGASQTESSLEIHPQPLRPGEIGTFEDHRVAMSFAILGCRDVLGNGQPWLRIQNPGCCGKTFPDFFSVLAAVRQASHG